MSRVSIIEQIRVAVLNSRRRELHALSLTIAGHHANGENKEITLELLNKHERLARMLRIDPDHALKTAFNELRTS